MIHRQRLKNTYYLMRHGQSFANIKNLIVSDPRNGLSEYGLTEIGKQQAEKALTDFKLLDSRTIIYSSDFLRTRQTALIAAKILHTHDKIFFTRQLRERFFGEWELTSSDHYERVWSQDLQQDTAEKNKVEPVEAVLSRTLLCLMEIEDKFKDKNILLVSHGDTLQILLAFFNDLPASRHREVNHMDVAEIRKADG